MIKEISSTKLGDVFGGKGEWQGPGPATNNGNLAAAFGHDVNNLLAVASGKAPAFPKGSRICNPNGIAGDNHCFTVE